MNSTNQTPKPENDLLFNLGAWLGRHQAFGLIANRCSAADAECLKQIRDTGTYRKLAPNWEEFCIRHAGVSRPTADKIIRNLERFGAAYFNLSRFVRVSPENFQAISGSLRDTHIEYEGEKIPIDREHAVRLAEVVEAMQRERSAAAGELERVRSGLDRAQRQLESSPAERKLRTALSRLDGVLAQLVSLNDHLDEASRAVVRQSLERISGTLEQLAA